MKTPTAWNWEDRLGFAVFWAGGVFAGALRRDLYANDIPAWAQGVMAFVLFLVLSWWYEKTHRFLGRFAFFRTFR